ncbi:unnamed protein product [Caenorhabditis sp. 36 PRJEB53466]|nr:unnamed protein product [Caenorhabditis sp. 36 PRJEB53466]
MKMRASTTKLLVAFSIAFFITVGLGVVNDFRRARLIPGWQKFETADDLDILNAREEYIIEKISQTQENSTDMRSELYLTHHGYLLENIAKMEVEYRKKTYTLNDLCYKPHVAVFEHSTKLTKNYIQRLFLEMRRLSPCLIVTPLNCFYDSYKLQEHIAGWSLPNEHLNMRLREEFIRALKENENDSNFENFYVNSDIGGPKTIEKWAGHMFVNSSLDISDKEKETILDSVIRWISSMEPRQEKCADPARPCERPPVNYFNTCQVMQAINEYGEKRHQKLKFSSGKGEITTQLDCVKDKEKFIDWMQEAELVEILKTLVPGVVIPDHEAIMNKRCDGIFHDVNSDGIELFDGKRSFNNEKNPFDTIRAELALMTPQSLLEHLRHVDHVNSHESGWTIEQAIELLEDFRSALRLQVHRFNDLLTSKKVGVTSKVIWAPEEREEIPLPVSVSVQFVLIFHAALLVAFSFLVWSANPGYSAVFFLVRDVITIAVIFFGIEDGRIIVLDSKILYFTALMTFSNLFLTTRISFLKHRLARCIQRDKDYHSSNFSSLGTVGSLHNSDVRQIQYILAKYTKFQAAKDVHSPEDIEKMPRFWYIIGLIIVPIVAIYWYFVDSSCRDIFFLLFPGFAITIAEELYLKKRYRDERTEKKREEQQLVENAGRLLTEKSLQNVFSGARQLKDKEEALEDQNDEKVALRQKSVLGHLSNSSYDVFWLTTYPNKISRDIRSYAFEYYYRLLKLEKLGLVICAVALLALCTAIALLFVPVSRVSDQFLKIEHDDLFIDIEIEDFLSSWADKNKRISQLTEDLDSIVSMKILSNWQKSFERFEHRISKTSPFSESSLFSDWTRNEPMNWAITASFATPDYRSRVPSPFQFRIRYELDDSRNETTMLATVRQIDDLLSKYSSDLSVKAFGRVYEHYHRNAVAWNPFALDELLSAVLFLCLFFIVSVLFTTSPSISATLLFALFAVATRLEIAAVISLFSLEHRLLYTYFALLVAFVAAFPPFCELCLFRARILYKKETRETPELSTRQRIRVPFIVAVDIAQFFGVVLAVCFVGAFFTLLVHQLNVFFVPTVILIAIQVLALANSIAISAATRQLFERDVRACLRRDLKGTSIADHVYDLAHKLLSPPFEHADIEMQIIQPATPQSRFWAPPKYPGSQKRRQSSDDSDDSEHLEFDEHLFFDDDSPKPSTSTQPPKLHFGPVRPNSPKEQKSEAKRMKTNEPFVFNFPRTYRLPEDPHHWVMEQGPIDNRPSTSQAERFEEAVERAEEYYALDEADAVERIRRDEEEEDLDSTGEPDEEVLAVEKKMQERWERKKLEELEKIKLLSESNSLQIQNEHLNGQLPNSFQIYREPIVEESPSPGCNGAASIAVEPPPPTTNETDEKPMSTNFQTEVEIPEGMRLVYPPMIPRTTPRDPLRQPPIMEELIVEHNGLGRHPRADQYPDRFTRAMVAYSEDIYWTERIVPLPFGLDVPPRPYDYFDLPEERTPPPEDFDYIPPPGTPPIDIPPEALELRDERRREYERLREEERRSNLPSNPDP